MARDFITHKLGISIGSDGKEVYDHKKSQLV
jgi:hypothetical protein